MRAIFVCLLAAFTIAAVPASAGPPGKTEITALGTGSISLPPDAATLNAAIETNAESANDAISQNNVRYDGIVAALTKLRIPRGDIALTYYNVNYTPRPRTGSTTADERYGYTVLRSFSVKVREIASAGRVSDACLGAGATAIDGISFGLSNPSAARTQATKKAVADARANAEAVAAAAALRIVGIRSIELTGNAPGPVSVMRAAAASSAPTELDQSNVTVTVSVSVVFLAEP